MLINDPHLEMRSISIPHESGLDSDMNRPDDGNESADPTHEDSSSTAQVMFAALERERRQAAVQALADHHAKSYKAMPEDRKEATAKDRYSEQSEKIIDKAREYQQELFERARDENIIAVLDTGTGKTLIAAMLIRHTLEQDLVESAEGLSPRNVFFLANRFVY